MIKTTYSLDVETVRALEALARVWKVSKSEALRRVIRTVAQRELSAVENEAVQALTELQQALDLSPDQARRWEKRIRAERDASAQRRGDRTR